MHKNENLIILYTFTNDGYTGLVDLMITILIISWKALVIILDELKLYVIIPQWKDSGGKWPSIGFTVKSSSNGNKSKPFHVKIQYIKEPSIPRKVLMVTILNELANLM